MRLSRGRLFSGWGGSGRLPQSPPRGDAGVHLRGRLYYTTRTTKVILIVISPLVQGVWGQGLTDLARPAGSSVLGALIAFFVLLVDPILLSV